MAGAGAAVHAALRVETLSRIEDAEALASQWRALELRQNRAVFFQSCDWCLYVWRTRLCTRDAGTPEPHVMVIRDSERFVAIWPLAVHASIAGRYAHDLTEPFGQYSDILVEPGADLEAIRTAAFDELSRWRIDGLVLRKVRDDAVLAPWFSIPGGRQEKSDAAPEIALGRLGGYDAYRHSLNAKTRKNLRNYRNRLAREGQLSHTVLDGSADAAQVIARCFDGRTDWLEASGLSSTAFADPAFEALVGGLANRARGAPPVLAMRLTIATADATSPSAPTEVSLHWGFEHAGRYYAYMASRNPAFDACSPGRLHLEDVIAALAERGIATVDLLSPALPYKTSLATGAVGISTRGRAFTLRGRLAIHGWHGRLRPAMKAALLALPPGARRFLVDGKERLALCRARLRAVGCPTASAASAPSRP